MAEVPGWASESVNPERRFRIDSRGFVVLITSFAIITWTGWKFWDTAILTSARLKIWNTFHGDDSIRRLKSGGGTLEERLSDAGNLRLVEGDDEIEEAIATLIATLDDENAEVRATAVHSLGALVFQTQYRAPEKPLAPEQVRKWKEAATSALVKGLSDKAPEFRAAVCMGLEMMSARIRPSSSPQLRAALQRGTVKWNRKTAKEYWGLTEEAPPPELVAALNDESLPVRMAAIQALARFPLGLDSAIPILFRMLEDSEPMIRRKAGQTLYEAWPTSVVVPTLIDALKTNNHAVRYCSALLLNRTESEANAAVPLLMAILQEPLSSAPNQEMSVRDFGFILSPSREAAIALGRIAPNETTIQLFIKMLSTGKPDEPGIPERWIYTAEALREMGPQTRMAVPALVAALNQLLDSQAPISSLYALVDAIGRFAADTPSAAAAADVLTRLLEPKYQAWFPDARAHAAEILGSFGRMATAAIPKLKALQNEKGLSMGTAEAAAASVAAIEADAMRNPSGSNSR